jgi:signal transduction histidine kinase
VANLRRPVVAIRVIDAHTDAMLEAFVIANRDEIISRARALVAERTSQKPSQAELKNGIPVFLDQLVEALHTAKTTEVVDHAKLAMTAARHGADLLAMGLTIGQVVHDYGDVCQTISRMALEQNVAIQTADFRTLNLCLDNAIAGAVTEYSRTREKIISDTATERLGTLAHELRNLLNVAILSFDVMKTGRVAVGGSTGLVHGRSLLGLRDLIDRSLADVRLEVGIAKLAHFSVAEMVAEVEIGATLLAKTRGLALNVSSVDSAVKVDGDSPILAAALSNLLNNAFKFTRPSGSVSLVVQATDTRVSFEVADECGGLPPGKAEELFQPYKQRGADRSGVGLGLAIVRKAAEASGGSVSVRDVAGKGCVFTLEVPRAREAP